MARVVPLLIVAISSMLLPVLVNGIGAGETSNLPVLTTQNQPPKPSGVQVLYAVEGSISCGNQGCHGRLDPLPQHPLLLNEATTWFSNDPHSGAYEILKEERSRLIADRLNGPGKPAHLDARCLACHANPTVAQFAQEHQKDLWDNPELARELERFATKGTGVGCESCHTSPGHSTGEYLAKHVDWGPTALGLGDWKSAGRLDAWESAGLAPLTRPATLVGLCSSCHVGGPGSALEPARDCDHDIMAAGHPRLIFDAATYLSRLPSHWNTKQYKDPESRMAGLHLAGQAVAAQKVISLSAVHARRESGPWPEFSDMDCFSCHAELLPSSGSWRHRGWLSGNLGRSVRPGHFVANATPVALTVALTGQPKAESAMEAWMKAIGAGRKSEVTSSADGLQVELEKWLVEAKAFEIIPPAKRSELLRRLADPAGKAIESGRWDEAEAFTVAMYWLSRGQKPGPESDMFDAAFAALAFPKGYQGPHGFHQTEKVQAMKRLADWFRNQPGRPSP